jgi:signal transduction histidine kinase
MTTPLRVLFIEDSEDDMLLQLRELRREGYAVEYRRVQRVEEVREALGAPGWDLVISDYSLPGFTGLEALRLVRESGHDVPFILISGTVGEEIAVEAMKAGAADYLLKDSLMRLVPAVRRELREAEHRRQRRLAVEHQRRLEAQLSHAQKLEALGTLASSISHDFNNVLAGIAGYVEMVRADTTDLPHVQQNVQLILRGIHRATDLVRRVLQFSRKRAVQRKPIHLGPAIHEALQFLRPLVPEGVALRVSLPAEGPLVVADAGQVQQVVLNLCTNAIQAMADAGGELAVEQETVEVDAALAGRLEPLRPGPHVRLAVRDTGVGIDAETLSQLFEPFFTTKPVGVGTGLGLAVVHGIVKSHQAAIEVTSRPGEGATFAVYFPAGDAAEEGRPALPGRGEHLMFVDDEDYLVQMGTALLTRLGYRVSAFNDPLKAHAAFAADPGAYDALVTDLTMPGLKGTELARLLREIRPGLPVILTTGFSGPHELDRAKALGYHRVLEKPYTVDKFVEALTEALRGEPRTK